MPAMTCVVLGQSVFLYFGQNSFICYNNDVMKLKITSFFIYILCLIIVLSGFLIWPNKIAECEILNTNKIRKADEILVKFKDSEEINVIKIAQADDFYQVLESYNKNKLVEYAEANYLYHAAIIPSDTYFNNQWYLQKIKAPEAWDDIRQSSDIIIAIMDSGVQIGHPDIKDNIWLNNKEIANNNIDDDNNGFIDDINGWDFVNNTADPSPKFLGEFSEAGILHGTIVAGVAAASGNNASGIAGVTWRAQIMPLKILNDAGEGNTNDVIKAIDYAIINGADIINFSFVGFGYSKSLADAIKRAYDRGVIVVAAAGNEQEDGEGYFLDDTPMYPVCHDGPNGENWVIGVAATDTLDQKAPFSSYGFNCVDIAAPGLSIFSTVVYAPTQHVGAKYFNKYYDGYWSGTSMATPIVSAAIALIEEANPSFNRNQVVGALLNNADNINRLNPDYLNQLGNGRLNLSAAINDSLLKLNEKITKLLIAPASNHLNFTKITDLNGKTELEFNSYGDNFFGGASIASGDVDGDGEAEIITGAGFTGGPHVRIFDQQGKLEGQFFAYAPHFRGGVKVAAGDVDGDGVDEIITGAGFTGGPHVRIFTLSGKLKGHFFAYDPGFRGGVNVAVANIDGGAKESRAEIITAPGPGGGPHIRIFDNQANVKTQFFAYNSNFRGGVNVAAGDVDNDGLAEIITGAGPGGTPHVRVFEADSKLIGSFFAYEDEFNGGVEVGVISTQNIK